MKRSVNTAELIAPASGALFEAAVAATSFFWRNPGVAGGSTAFAVAFLFVSANAVWYQEHRHPAPLFASRALTGAERLEERTARYRVVRGENGADPAIVHVQNALTDKEFYTGVIDGVSGRRTREAVAKYRTSIGLDPEGGIDATLLRRLGYVSHEVPRPSPAPRTVSLSDRTGSVREATHEPAEDVSEVQGALTRLGYADIDIDGLMGGKTRSAIRDFQRKNDLAITGEADPELLKALRKVTPGG